MEFRRGQRDERRRRVLMDEKLAAPETSEEVPPSRSRKPASGESSTNGKGYSDDALHERQPRIVDLLPARPWTLAVLNLSALAFVALMATLFVYLPEIGQFATRADLAAIDLAGPHSLATWFSTLLFTLAAGGSLLIYSLRRHKIDDYRGRYLVWLPAAVVLLLLSIDATTGLHRLATGPIVQLSGLKGFGDGTIWSIAVYGLLLATLGVRLAIEMRRSRAANAALATAAVCYGLAAPISLGIWLAQSAPLSALAQSVAALCGHVGIAASVAFYARFVYLDAQGRIVPRQSKARQPKKPAKESAADEANTSDSDSAAKSPAKVRRIDAPHTEAPAASPAPSPAKAPGPLASKMAAVASSGSASKFGDPSQPKASAAMTRPAPSSHDDDDEEDDGEDDDDDSRLSKAERRRLRKMQRRR